MLAILLSPVPNLAAAATAAFVASRLSFFPAVVSVLFMAVSYVVVGPRVQRNKSLWAALCPKPSKPLSTAGDLRQPAIVIAHFLTSSGSRLVDAAALRGGSLEGSVVCVPHTRAFHMPLSRAVIYLLGGIVPYTRNVLINLLKRKAAAPVVVAYPVSPATASNGSLELSLSAKGVFSAALRSGATIVPCVVADGNVAYGEPITAAAPDVAPAPEAVVALAADYAKRLESVDQKHFKRRLTVTH